MNQQTLLGRWVRFVGWERAVSYQCQTYSYFDYNLSSEQIQIDQSVDIQIKEMSLLKKIMKMFQHVVPSQLSATSSSKLLWSLMPFLFVSTTYILYLQQESNNYDSLFYQLYDLKKVGDIDEAPKVQIEQRQRHRQQQQRLQQLRRKILINKALKN